MRRMRMSRRDPAYSVPVAHSYPKPSPPSKAAVEAEQTLRDSIAYLDHRRDEAKPMKMKTPSKASVAEAGIATLEVGVGALAGGLYAGYTGTTGFGTTGVLSSIPVGATVGLAGQVLALFGVFGKAGPHAANVMNGLIGSSLTLWAAGKGSQARAAAGGPPGPIVAGVPAIGTAPVHGVPQIGAAPAYNASPFAPPRQMNGMNPFAGRNVPRPLSEAELQAMSRAMP